YGAEFWAFVGILPESMQAAPWSFASAPKMCVREVLVSEYASDNAAPCSPCLNYSAGVLCAYAITCTSYTHPRENDMARTTPQVLNDPPTDHGGPDFFVVGSPAWFAGLGRAQLFAFRGAAGTFPARQEARAGGGAYWRASQTVGGRQRRASLGRTAD